ncbi:MAG: transposase, partial [Candidimonas sp.]
EIPKSDAVGIDMGLSDFITTSDGEIIDNLKPFKKKQRRLKIRQRRLSKKASKSNNRSKARKQVYRIHRKIREQRKDFHHKTANNLLKDYDLICIEDLNVKGLMRTKLAKSIQDSGWSSFQQILEYKATLLGKSVASIGRFDPSSKTCNGCGNKKDMPLNIRVYKCECGHEMSRDLNAALNILDWGYDQYTVGTTEIYASQIRAHKTSNAKAPMASSGEEAKSSLEAW